MDDVVSNVSKSVPEVFTWGTEALERCGHVTDGWGLCGLLKTLEVVRVHNGPYKFCISQ